MITHFKGDDSDKNKFQQLLIAMEKDYDSMTYYLYNSLAYMMALGMSKGQLPTNSEEFEKTIIEGIRIILDSLEGLVVDGKTRDPPS